MKKFSKLLAVLVALAVIICPMTSAIVANATTTGSYSIVADTANDVVLTIHSDDGFVVYQATVTFNSDSSFVNNYSSNGYTNGLKVVDYAMVDAAKDAYNAPAISAQQSGSSLVLLVSATDGANMDLYEEIQIGIRVQSGTTANLSNIKAADDGDVTEDPTLLNFGSKVNASSGNVTIDGNPNATTGESHTHDFQMTNTVVATPATCSTPVQYYKVCSICGATGDTYAGDTYADHTPTVQAKDAAHLASAATCTADATYYYGCAVCGTVVTSTKQGYTGTWTDTGSATNHANKVFHAASAATCIAAGNTAYYSCPDCGKYFSDAACTIEIPADSWVIATTAHSPANTETYLKTAATCTADAVYFQTCSVCNAKLDTTWTKAGTATGHSFTSYTYNNDATCTAAGTETATCANGCGTTDTRTSAEHPALGHDWQVASVTPATCTEAGNTHYTCSRCDATKDEAIAATGHTEETIPAVAPTCTTAGATAGVKCSVCNEILTAPTPIAALGHNMTAHTANAATCTAAGNSAYWSCDRCNKFFSDEEGNTEIAENSWVISATGHTPVTDAAVAATCVATGLTEGSHCSVCSAVLVAQTETPIDPTNHTNIVNDAAVAATCTETGLTAGSHCADCSAVIVAQETVNALGHNFETYTYNNDATCTDAGTKTATCTRCDATDTVADPEHPALGHDWQVASVTPATCTEAGNTHYTCSRCDATKDEPIAATGHNMTPHAAVAATCTTAGNSAYWSCDRCNKYFSDAEGNTEIEADSWVIAATGHTEETIPAVAATCTTAGSTAGVKCSVCNAVLTAPEVVPALGHDYTYTSNEDGTHDVGCTRCDLADTEDCDTAGTDGACSKCGYKATPAGSVLDASIVTLAPQISITETINITFRATKATTTNNASYANTKMIIIATKYDSNNMLYTADPVEAEFFSLTSKNNGAIFYDIATYEMDLPLTAYVACYNELGVEVAHSANVVATPADLLKALYTETPSTDRARATNKLVTDTLNLGAAAQYYFGNQKSGSSDLKSATLMNTGWDQTYATGTLDSLANVSSFTWNPSSPVTSSTNNVTTSANLTGAPVIGFNIMRAAPTGAAPLDFSKLSMTVSYNTLYANNGGAGVITDTVTGSDWNQYVVGKNIRYSFKKSAMYDSDKTVTAVITYDGVEVCTVTYSLDTYVLENKDNASTGNILKAIARFTAAARGYFSAVSGKTV